MKNEQEAKGKLILSNMESFIIEHNKILDWIMNKDDLKLEEKIMLQEYLTTLKFFIQLFLEKEMVRNSYWL